MKLIEKIADAPKAKKNLQGSLPKTWGVLYVGPSPDGKRKGCFNCMMFVSKDKQCEIHDVNIEVTKDHTCGYWVFGKPHPKRMHKPDNVDVQAVDPKHSGLAKVPGGTSCDNCFPAGTPVLMSNGSEKNIEDIIPGDAVIGFNGFSICDSEVEVIGSREARKEDLCRVTLWSGHKHTILTTKEHPFYVVGKGYIKAIDLLVGDDVFKIHRREWSRLRMKRNNPMHDVKTAKMVGAKVAELRKSGKMKWNMSEEGKRSNSERMKAKNPARLPHVREASRARLLDPSHPMRSDEAIRKRLKSQWNRPTGLEIKFIKKVVEEYGLPLSYIGDGSMILRSGDEVKIPDFKVNGQKKLVEVYDTRWPERVDGWMGEKSEFYASLGYKTLFLPTDKMSPEVMAGRVTELVNNGAEVKRVTIYNSKYSRNWPESLLVYNIQTTTHNYFVKKMLVHNCEYYKNPKNKKGTCIVVQEGIGEDEAAGKLATVEALGCCARWESK